MHKIVAEKCRGIVSIRISVGSVAQCIKLLDSLAPFESRELLLLMAFQCFLALVVVHNWRTWRQNCCYWKIVSTGIRCRFPVLYSAVLKPSIDTSNQWLVYLNNYFD